MVAIGLQKSYAKTKPKPLSRGKAKVLRKLCVILLLPLGITFGNRLSSGGDRGKQFLKKD
jgi:hypothetical protein